MKDEDEDKIEGEREQETEQRCNSNKKRWWIKWTIAASIETTTEQLRTAAAALKQQKKLKMKRKKSNKKREKQWNTFLLFSRILALLVMWFARSKVIWKMRLNCFLVRLVCVYVCWTLEIQLFDVFNAIWSDCNEQLNRSNKLLMVPVRHESKI